MLASEEYNQLAYYTLSHPGQDFIHQHIVDAYTIQTASENTKPIAIVYALAGLYLHVVKNYTGKQVQSAHIIMSKKSKEFPTISLPDDKGSIHIKEVLSFTDPIKRDLHIHKWCVSIWEACSAQHALIIEITERLIKNPLSL